jgi:hypothetical protein
MITFKHKCVWTKNNNERNVIVNVNYLISLQCISCIQYTH